MLKILVLLAMVAGLLMYLLPTTNAKITRIGEILLASSILALLIAAAPLTLALLQG